MVPAAGAGAPGGRGYGCRRAEWPVGAPPRAALSQRGEPLTPGASPLQLPIPGGGRALGRVVRAAGAEQTCRTILTTGHLHKGGPEVPSGPASRARRRTNLFRRGTWAPAVRQGGKPPTQTLCWGASLGQSVTLWTLVPHVHHAVRKALALRGCSHGLQSARLVPVILFGGASRSRAMRSSACRGLTVLSVSIGPNHGEQDLLVAGGDADGHEQNRKAVLRRRAGWP